MSGGLTGFRSRVSGWLVPTRRPEQCRGAHGTLAGVLKVESEKLVVERSAAPISTPTAARKAKPARAGLISRRAAGHTKNERPKPESIVESVTSIFAPAPTIPKRPVDGRPYTVDSRASGGGRIEQGCDSQKPLVENKHVSCESQCRGPRLASKNRRPKPESSVEPATPTLGLTPAMTDRFGAQSGSMPW